MKFKTKFDKIVNGYQVTFYLYTKDNEHDYKSLTFKLGIMSKEFFVWKNIVFPDVRFGFGCYLFNFFVMYHNWKE
jgi:hypothetical protein